MPEAHPLFACIIRIWRERQHTIFTHADLIEELNRLGIESDLAIDLRFLKAHGLIESRSPDTVMLTAYGMSQGIAFPFEG